MTAIDYATMFLSNFFVVFLLGLQSKNVQMNRYVAAVVTSIGISVGQFMFVKYAVQGSYDVFAVSALGGALGIATSIWFYKRVMEKKREG
jgi:hypothetical protein